MSKYFFGHNTEEECIAALDRLGNYLKEEELKLLKMKVEKLEKLKYLTTLMKQDFLKNNNLKDIGISIRFSTKDLYKALLANVSTTIKEEILYAVQEKYPIKEFVRALDGIIDYVDAKVRAGEYILNKDLFDETV